MLIKILLASGLVVVTVAMHAVGLDALLRVMIRSHALDRSGFRSVTGMVIGLTCWLLLIHLAEIAVWGLVLLSAGLLARCRVGVLFFRRHLHDRWLRRSGVA